MLEQVGALQIPIVEKEPWAQAAIWEKTFLFSIQHTSLVIALVLQGTRLVVFFADAMKLAC